MANQKISEMTSDTTLTGTEVIPMVDGGVNKKTTAAAIAALAPGGGGAAPTFSNDEFDI